jgi:hypothetical protein
LSSELEGDQERLLRLGRDLLGRDRLGGVLLLVDLLVWLGDLTLTECRGTWNMSGEGSSLFARCWGRSPFGLDQLARLLQIYQTSVLFLD